MGHWTETRGLVAAATLGMGSVPVNTRHQKEAGSAGGVSGLPWVSVPGRAHTHNCSF